MEIPAHVVPERFHPTAMAVGLPQLALPCGDPACAAEPGEECGPFCTHGDAGSPSRGDLVAVVPGSFAVRTCPRCAGTGEDRTSPNAAECRCQVDSLEALELRAADLAERASKQHPDQARRSNALARRCLAHALVAALREQGVIAHVRRSRLVTVETPRGPLCVSVDPTAPGRATIRRTDRTRWRLRTPTAARPLAAQLGLVVPELTHPSGPWVVIPPARSVRGVFGLLPPLGLSAVCRLVAEGDLVIS